jgi:hypothetical protein
MAARRNLDPQELATALGKMTEVPEGAQSRSYLFLGTRGDQRGDRSTTGMTMLVPPSEARTKQLLRLAGNPGADPRDVRGTTRYGEAHRKGRLVLTVFVAVLLAILLPLALALIGLVGYLTLIVMTIALAGGLALVVALV